MIPDWAKAIVPRILSQITDETIVCPSPKSDESLLRKFVCYLLELLLNEWSKWGHPKLLSQANFRLGGVTKKYRVALNCKFRYNPSDAADIAILYECNDHPEPNVEPLPLWKYPLVIGELKGKFPTNDKKSSFHQLLSYQLAVQRPFQVDENNGNSQMLGFMLDYNEGYIIELTFDKWTAEKPLPVPASSIIPHNFRTTI